MKVLVVDDSDEVRAIVAEMLRGSGYETVECSDGEEAIVKLNQDQFDIVVTDLIMPKESGLSLANYIRKSGNRIPILAISGHLSSVVCDTLGVTDYFVDKVLYKPFQESDLIVAVESLLSGAADGAAGRSAR